MCELHEGTCAKQSTAGRRSETSLLLWLWLLSPVGRLAHQIPEGCVFGVPQHPTLYVAQQGFQSRPREQEEPMSHLKGLAPGHTGMSACMPGLCSPGEVGTVLCSHGTEPWQKGLLGPIRIRLRLKGKRTHPGVKSRNTEASEGRACFLPCVTLVAHLAHLQGCGEGVAREGAVLLHICSMSSCCQLIRRAFTFPSTLDDSG